jgi:hypothetical protein
VSERGLLAIAEAIFALADAISAPKEPRKRSKSAKTPPPEDLSVEDKRELLAWATRSEPWAVPKLRELVNDMLQWHRSNSVSRASWYITAQRWVTNARTKFGQDKQPAKGGTRRGDVLDAARELREALGLGGEASDDDEAFLDVSPQQPRQH